MEHKGGSEWFLKLLDLLQWKLGSASLWHVPNHLEGTGPYPSSLKLLDSGQTPTFQLHEEYYRKTPHQLTQKNKRKRKRKNGEEPVSKLAIMVSSPSLVTFQMESEGISCCLSIPRKFHDLVVCNCLSLLSKTDITFGNPAMHTCNCTTLISRAFLNKGITYWLTGLNTHEQLLTCKICCLVLIKHGSKAIDISIVWVENGILGYIFAAQWIGKNKHKIHRVTNLHELKEAHLPKTDPNRL